MVGDKDSLIRQQSEC